MRLRIACAVVAFLSFALSMAAQTSPSSSASAQVPPLIQFSSVAADEGGNTMSGAVSITFSLYGAQQGGEALWAETQKSVQLDSTGHYSVQLGITKTNGVPLTLFTTGEARWMGIRIAEQPEQPRVLLLSVPYAMKAGDAATIGGLPPSAFVLATAQTATSAALIPEPATGQTAPPPTATDVTTTGGMVNFLPLFNGTTTILDSVIFQSAASPFKIGINTASPATTLDVKGTATIRGALSLPATGAATATKGTNSEPLSLAAASFSSTTSTPVNQVFRWQAEPAGNDTASPSATLNLLFASGTSIPSETGLSIASNGGVTFGAPVTFAAGQTFPGTGDGTITEIAAGAGLSGGGSSGSVTLANTGILGLTAGTGVSLSSGQSPTVGVNTALVPLLTSANTFIGNQTVNGNLSATGVMTGSSYQIGSSLFAFGSFVNSNAFLGFAGNTTTTGFGNTATGSEALFANTAGYLNTASGSEALYTNTTGNLNTASGAGALLANVTGSYNTASGADALFSNTTGPYNTATGYAALNTNTTGPYNTATGYAALYSNTTANYNTASGAQALFSNTTGEANLADGALALYSNTTGAGNTGVGADALYSNTTSNYVTCLGYSCTASDNITNATAIGAHAAVEQSNALVLGGTGDHAVFVGIGTTKPSNIFTVARGAGHPVSDSWETYSSRRWKTNIQTLHGALEKVEQLRGVSYDLKASGKHEVGVIAEEVGAVVPEVVSFEENGKDARGVDYSRLTALLIEATKEQQREIQQQQAVLRTQAAAIRDLKSELRATRQTLQKVKAQVAGVQPTVIAAK
jgi:Chaperone of endosialidase